MVRGAVFFDVDGTLIDTWQGIPAPTAKTREAVARLQHNGYLAIMATGRAKCYFPQGLDFFDGYVTSNGAYAEVDGQAVLDATIGRADLQELVDYLEPRGINYIMENQTSCYCKHPEQPAFLTMMTNFGLTGREFMPLTDLFAVAPNKLMVTYSDMDQEPAFRAAFGHKYDITLQPGNPASDVGMKGVSKGYGVARVLEALRLPREKTYAFGDADNDLTMLETVGCGVAMGRHTEGVGRVARSVTGTVAEEGVYEGLVQLGLI